MTQRANLTVCLTLLLSACSHLNQPNQLLLANTNVHLGMTYLAHHQLKLGRQALLLSLHEAPQDPAVWSALGYYSEQAGANNKARQDYQHAIALNPKSGIALNNYGTFLCRIGAYNKAIQVFNKAAQQPNYPDPQSAYHNAAVCALKVPSRALANYYFRLAQKFQ